MFKKERIRNNANKEDIELCYRLDLKKGFVLKKEKIYLLSRIEREKIQKFVKD